MEFQVLGPFEVRREGGPVPLGPAKQRTLLAILLVRANEIVSSDRLIEELWPEPPDTAGNALQVYVHKLRKALEPERRRGESGELLITRAPGYMLRVEPDQLDAGRFERLLGDGRAAAEAGDPATAARTLAQALELWRGPAYADFAYDPFAQAEIARLEELRLDAVEDRIEADLALGGAAELVGELEALIGDNPLRERLRGQLMLALYRAGRQADALEAYDEARRTLDEELGLAPSPPLQRLQTDILRQAPALEVSIEVADRPADLAATSPEPSGVAAAPEVRKTVTVLIARRPSVRGVDPEALSRDDKRYREHLARTVDRHGGTIASTLGDEVMAVFGVPRSHEDDAVRAVSAALEIRDAPAQDATVAGAAPRIGVASGEALGQRFGQRPADVRRRAGHRRARAPGRRGGRGDPHRRGDRAARPRPRRGRGRGHRGGPGVASSRAAARAARSRLARQRRWSAAASSWAAYATRSSRSPASEAFACSRSWVRRGSGSRGSPRSLRARPATRPPWSSGGACRTARASRSGRCARSSASSRAGRLGADGNEAGPIAEELRDAIGVADASVEREEIFWATRSLFTTLAGERPLVVFFEDVHWAEPTFLDLVEYLAETAERAPIFLVCIARPELLEHRPDWTRERQNAGSLELEPLPDPECEALIGNLAGGLAPETKARVLETAEGNPLFIEQLVAMIAEARSADGELSIPPTIDALLSARLDRLGPGERAVISRAAIVGKEFSSDATLDLLPADAREFGERHLETLSRKEFIRPAPAPDQRRRLPLPSHPDPAGRLPRDPEEPAGGASRAVRRLGRRPGPQRSRRELGGRRLPPRAGVRVPIRARPRGRAGAGAGAPRRRPPRHGGTSGVQARRHAGDGEPARARGRATDPAWRAGPRGAAGAGLRAVRDRRGGRGERGARRRSRASACRRRSRHRVAGDDHAPAGRDVPGPGGDRPGCDRGRDRDGGRGAPRAGRRGRDGEGAHGPLGHSLEQGSPSRGERHGDPGRRLRAAGRQSPRGRVGARTERALRDQRPDAGRRRLGVAGAVASSASRRTGPSTRTCPGS